jgi:hypothetical protein
MFGVTQPRNPGVSGGVDEDRVISSVHWMRTSLPAREAHRTESLPDIDTHEHVEIQTDFAQEGGSR